MRRFFIFILLGLTMMCCQCRVKKAVSENSDVAEPVVQYQVIQGDTLEYVDSTCYAISKDRFIYRGDTLVKSVRMWINKKSIQCKCSSFENTIDSLEKSGYDLIGMDRYYHNYYGITLTTETLMKIARSPEGTLLSLFQGWVSDGVYQLVAADNNFSKIYLPMIIDLKTMQIIEYGFRIDAGADIYDVISLWEIKNILDGIREFEICFKNNPYTSDEKHRFFALEFFISFKGKVIIQ